MTIRVVTIGAGYFSQYHHDAGNRIPGVALEAVCTRRNAQKLREIAQCYGVRRTYLDAARMLDEVKPDLVDIITTPESHLQFVTLAAERRIPAICQKPLPPRSRMRIASSRPRRRQAPCWWPTRTGASSLGSARCGA